MDASCGEEDWIEPKKKISRSPLENLYRIEVQQQRENRASGSRHRKRAEQAKPYHSSARAAERAKPRQSSAKAAERAKPHHSSSKAAEQAGSQPSASKTTVRDKLNKIAAIKKRIEVAPKATLKSSPPGKNSPTLQPSVLPKLTLDYIQSLGKTIGKNKRKLEKKQKEAKDTRANELLVKKLKNRFGAIDTITRKVNATGSDGQHTRIKYPKETASHSVTEEVQQPRSAHRRSRHNIDNDRKIDHQRRSDKRRREFDNRRNYQ